MQSWKSRTSQISQEEILEAAQQAGIAEQIVQPAQQPAQQQSAAQPQQQSGYDNTAGRYSAQAATEAVQSQHQASQQHRPSAVQQALDAAKSGPWQQDMIAAEQQMQQQPQSSGPGVPPGQVQRAQGVASGLQQQVAHTTTSSYGTQNNAQPADSTPGNIEGRQYRQALNNPAVSAPATIADSFKQASQVASSGQHNGVPGPAASQDTGIYTNQFRRDRFGLDALGEVPPQAKTTAIPAAPQFVPPADATGPLAAPTPNQAYVNAATGVTSLAQSYGAVSTPTSTANVVDPTAERSFIPPELQNKQQQKPKELPLVVLIVCLVLVLLAGVAAGWFIFNSRSGSETSTDAVASTAFSAQLMVEVADASGALQISEVNGPVQVSDATPYKLQASNLPDGVQAEVTLDGQPVAPVGDSFPIGFNTAGRHTIEVKAEGESTITIAQYAFVPKVAPEFVAELALLDKENTSLADALTQFDGLKTNHDALELNESSFFKELQAEHYILFVGGFESQEAADTYCKDSGATPCTARELAPN